MSGMSSACGVAISQSIFERCLQNYFHRRIFYYLFYDNRLLNLYAAQKKTPD